MKLIISVPTISTTKGERYSEKKRCDSETSDRIERIYGYGRCSESLGVLASVIEKIDAIIDAACWQNSRSVVVVVVDTR